MENYIKKEESKLEEKNIENDENIKMEINKNNFRFELETKIKITNDDEEDEPFKGESYIKKVIELSEDKLGILFEIRYNKCLFFIYSSKTFALIQKFENNAIKDAIKMEDNILVLCDEYNIIFYKLMNKEYKFMQAIQIYDKEKYMFEYSRNHRNYNTCIYFLYHLKNDDLIVGSYSEMKIYTKKDRYFSLKKELKNVEYYIKNIIEIKPNIIVLFLLEALENIRIPNEYQYYNISLYDLQNNKYKILNKTNYTKYGKYNFLKIDKYLFAKYNNCLDIYDIEQNMKFINETDYKIINESKKEKELKYKIPFEHFKIELTNNCFLVAKKDGK